MDLFFASLPALSGLAHPPRGPFPDGITVNGSTDGILIAGILILLIILIPVIWMRRRWDR